MLHNDIRQTTHNIFLSEPVCWHLFQLASCRRKCIKHSEYIWCHALQFICKSREVIAQEELFIDRLVSLAKNTWLHDSSRLLPGCLSCLPHCPFMHQCTWCFVVLRCCPIVKDPLHSDLVSEKAAPPPVKAKFGCGVEDVIQEICKCVSFSLHPGQQVVEEGFPLNPFYFMLVPLFCFYLSVLHINCLSFLLLCCSFLLLQVSPVACDGFICAFAVWSLRSVLGLNMISSLEGWAGSRASGRPVYSAPRGNEELCGQIRNNHCIGVTNSGNGLDSFSTSLWSRCSKGMPSEVSSKFASKSEDSLGGSEGGKSLLCCLWSSLSPLDDRIMFRLVCWEGILNISLEVYGKGLLIRAQTSATSVSCFSSLSFSSWALI